MKWMLSKLTRTFSGLLVSNFLILLCVTTAAYFYSLQQLEQTNAMLERLTDQKTVARQIWNDLQETNIEIQEALLKEAPVSSRLTTDLKRTTQTLERFASAYPSDETTSYRQTSTNLIRYYEKVLIPLTENQQPSADYLDFSTMRRMVKDASLVIPLQSMSSGTERSALDTMYFFSTTRQAADQYISSIHLQEQQAQKANTDDSLGNVDRSHRCLFSFEQLDVSFYATVDEGSHSFDQTDKKSLCRFHHPVACTSG